MWERDGKRRKGRKGRRRGEEEEKRTDVALALIPSSASGSGITIGSAVQRTHIPTVTSAYLYRSNQNYQRIVPGEPCPRTVSGGAKI